MTGARLMIAIASFVWEADAPRSLLQWVVLPEIRGVAFPELGTWLDEVPKPAFVAILAEPGYLVVLPVRDLPAAMHARIERHLKNQQEYFRAKYEIMPDACRTGHVRVTLPDLTATLPVDDVERFIGEYVVSVPWTLHPVTVGDPHVALDVRRVNGGHATWSAMREAR